MKLTFRKTLFLIVSLSYAMNSIGQTKKEREQRIKVSEFPKNAIEVIETLPNHCKRFKFYKETDGQKHSFETKFKYKGRHYSLEFSKRGIIEDIEVIIKLRHINDTIKENVETYFKQHFIKHNFIKIQEQYIFSPHHQPSEFLKNVLLGNSKPNPNFEIIAEVKTKQKRELREFTFGENGTFISSRTLSPTSYEHVLY